MSPIQVAFFLLVRALPSLAFVFLPLLKYREYIFDHRLAIDDRERRTLQEYGTVDGICLWGQKLENQRGEEKAENREGSSHIQSAMRSSRSTGRSVPSSSRLCAFGWLVLFVFSMCEVLHTLKSRRTCVYRRYSYLRM
jgi:hypothetical protein